MRAHTTTEERAAIVADYVGGRPVAAIAAAHGRSLATVYACVHEAALPMRNPPIPPRTERQAFAHSVAAALLETLPPELRREAAALL